MSLRSDVLLWAVRIAGRPRDAPAHVLLDVKIDATLEEAQEAFHKIARSSHPDLHRSSLSPEELEQVTDAYARVAGAYQEFRSKRALTTRMRPLDVPLPPGTTPSTPGSDNLPAQKAPSSSGHSLANAANMNAKAQIYYRKVEMSLRRGDVTGAVLQMKMAIAADPASTFLRSALTEILAELAKKG
ncbi:MAG TPA: hypothetical protein VGM90_18355 [Kofleriaceae bacterium]|jgi:hypothetical protein